MSTSKTMPLGFSVSKAHEVQKRLCGKIAQEDRFSKRIRLVAGVDAAYFDDIAIGAVAVLDYESLRLLKSETATVQAKFPYVSTLFHSEKSRQKSQP
jgi:deoxyinosine 3'endonuclease (endonuclease V)